MCGCIGVSVRNRKSGGCWSNIATISTMEGLLDPIFFVVRIFFPLSVEKGSGVVMRLMSRASRDEVGGSAGLEVWIVPIGPVMRGVVK